MFGVFGTMRPVYPGGSMAEAAEAQREAKTAQQRVSELEEQVERLTLACASMWELIQQKTGLTEDQLVDRITEVDARDGQVDGRLTRGVHPCSKCGRPVPARRQKCLYCGAEQAAGGVFESI